MCLGYLSERNNVKSMLSRQAGIIIFMMYV